jgi:hypothetical protein
MKKYLEYEAVWQNSQAKGNDFLLLLALAKFRQNNECFCTKETLAELMNCNVDTVDRSLKRLRALGELSWDKGSNFSKRANRYYINLPNLDLNTPANSPRNSQEIPPQTHGKYPRNITPLNSNETEVKTRSDLLKFDSSHKSDCYMVSKQTTGLPGAKVLELLQLFSKDWNCTSTDNEKTRLNRWFEYLDKFAASQTKRKM